MLKIAILSGPENGSPKVLARTLEPLIKDSGHYPQIFYRIKALTRLFSAKQVNSNKFLWIFFKITHFIGDQVFFAKLKRKDAVIVCACSPYGFYKDSYNIAKFKKIIKNKPVLYYAVQYLENSPTIKEKLKSGGHASIERYDWHLTVSAITEIRGIPAPPWNQIGLNLKSSGLKPEQKDEFLAVVDFVRPRYENYREIQIKVLEELGIKYISLEKPYTLEEIREIYKRSSIYFIQFPEAYGMPIAECLACGSYIGTPHSSWPMSWRLDEKVEVHGSGTLPECFFVYDGEENLKKQLKELKDNYDLKNTPKKVFDDFYKHYPTFYEGNMVSLQDVLKRIGTKNLILE
jgi:hypothetical protein